MGDLISRDAAIAEIDCGGCYGKCVDPANCRIDISREAVDSLAGELILACDKAAQLRTEITATEDDGRHMAVTLLALRAALDAAEAETARAVEAERERCAAMLDTEADKCDNAARWGGSKRYVTDCKAAAYALRDRAAAIRTRAKP